MTDSLHLISPLDSRYADLTAALREFFSEFAHLRTRVEIEVDFLTALSKISVMRRLTESESMRLKSIAVNFNDVDAEGILEHERKTRHDVKAIEYFLRDKLAGTSLEDVIPWLHFGLTSEDVNNISQARAFKDARDRVLMPGLESLLNVTRDFAYAQRGLPMLARTHGQPAVPTTLGKEYAVFYDRIKKAGELIASHRFEAKLNGAVGNFNALQAAAPQVDWIQFSDDLITGYGLTPNRMTTQILPHDNQVRFFDALKLVNSILIDMAQDTWRYISDGWLKQAVEPGEVGSSTMPQKVNPIDFENAEGNLGIANALFNHYAQKLPISRLQRDLSDSTVRRTFGTALGHSLVAWQNMRRGMQRIAPDEERIKAELNAHWEVVSEGAQTILRAAGRSEAYESLKARTRGQVLSEADYLAWVDEIDMDDGRRALLQALSPESYTGLAEQLTLQILGEGEER
jgi:adenylosuccinate lyase